ncbi:MAG: STAS/SEC14 domain-containing protein [Thermodesulfobacteriota bacterium]
MGKDFTINQISDREFRAGENHYLLGDDNIFHVTLNGDVDDEMGTEIDRRINRLVDNVDGQIDLLIDLNRAGKTSSKSRQLFKAFTETGKCRKVALFGMHTVAMVIASFVMGISKNRNMKFFKNRKEALEWLIRQ